MAWRGKYRLIGHPRAHPKLPHLRCAGGGKNDLRDPPHRWTAEIRSRPRCRRNTPLLCRSSSACLLSRSQRSAALILLFLLRLQAPRAVYGGRVIASPLHPSTPLAAPPFGNNTVVLFKLQVGREKENFPLTYYFLD